MKYNLKSVAPQQGFSLIEVMIALLVVAVSLAALSQTLATLTHQQASLTERAYAGWVAQNRLVEIQASVGSEIERQQEVELLGVTWQTELQFDSTPIPGMVRATLLVEVKGAANPAARLVTVVGE
ncbi:type II secretion system minor pseudopilin GspI [Thiomicrospira cyclica]|uniref:type II secretion system minor pseudopilin GspI n=1 Tax=Thiomicrospira cyclica TaxID=147268 RepID=UPI0002FBC550|nr:type II secretion system minor pseudopilin GspI [Thiomicrospira cyclica]